MIWNNYIGIDFLVPEYICKNIIEIGEEKRKQGLGHAVINKNRNDWGIDLSGIGSYKYSENIKFVDTAIKFSLEEFFDKFTPNLSFKNYSYIDHKFQKANKGGGFYSWHSEIGGINNKRAFVWMLYLNTVENGGKTEFFKTKDEILQIKPETGKFVFWPAGETHIHRSSPDLQEIKYILTGWVNRL